MKENVVKKSLRPAGVELVFIRQKCIIYYSTRALHWTAAPL